MLNQITYDDSNFIYLLFYIPAIKIILLHEAAWVAIGANRNRILV